MDSLGHVILLKGMLNVISEDPSCNVTDTMGGMKANTNTCEGTGTLKALRYKYKAVYPIPLPGINKIMKFHDLESAST